MTPQTIAGMRVNSLENMNEDIIPLRQVVTIFTLTFTNTLIFGANLCRDLRSTLHLEGPMKDGAALHMALTDYSAIPKTTRMGPSPWGNKVAWGANSKFAIFLRFGGLMNT